MRATDRFEYATAADPSRNYCLWEYQPPAPPEDKYRAINVLYQSFATAGLDERAYAVVEAIRDAIGPFRTVFGIKFTGGGLAWEFYFYDYARRRREVSITRVLDAIRPYMPCAVRPRESLPYFMFSLDLDADLLARRRELDVVHMYVGNPGNTVSSGIAYAIRADSTTLENFYFFFDARAQLGEVAGKIASSAVFDDSHVPMDLVLVPEYRDCQTICVANKRTHDCVYFSGVDVGQLALFLGRLSYPPAIRAFIDESRSELGHLLFDIGFDYRSEGGQLQILKSGYYGVF